MKSLKIVAFDIYGTLIDVKGVYNNTLKLVGDDQLASSFVEMWRQKQLEYSFRRGLMRNYVDFSLCTKQALEYVIQYLRLNISEKDKIELLDSYKRLPTYPDVNESLAKLQERDVKLYAFSNGKPEDLRELLKFNGIINYFDEIISVDPIKSFKPDPAVYLYLLRKTNGFNTDLFMISANPFDVIGAKNAGLLAVWLNRDQKGTFDPWEIKFDYEINGLSELINIIDI